MSEKVGTVLNYENLPDVSKFPFVISKQSSLDVKKGLFVYTESMEGFLIGIVEKIVLLNEYFSDALTIKSYNTNTNPNILKGLFPSEDFEFAIAIVGCLGIVQFSDENKKEIETIKRMAYPATPGKEVFLVSEQILNAFIGLDNQQGINLGNIKVSGYPAKINMNRLLNKHFAILAISGAGKSYLMSVLIEELLEREDKYGTPQVVLIDVHGEYTYLNEIPELVNHINVQNTRYFQIAVPKLSAYKYQKFQRNISNVQVRELAKYIRELRKDDEKHGIFSLSDIIDKLECDEEISKSTRQALTQWLLDLQRLQLFGPQENPKLTNLIKEKKLTIFDLSNEINLRKKQIIVNYISERLFNLRRRDKIPPFLIVIEEAHQFCPEAKLSKAISKPIIETIAREGRKFMSCLALISQRPKKLSVTALSQMNSKLVLNIKNPYDLRHLMDSSEAITKEYAEIISSLGIGEMLLMGNAVNFPIFLNVRQRHFTSNEDELSLADVCLKWQKKQLEQK
ncbi:MAG: ATP-binding protein [Promethearchaeia archaeon]